MSSRLPDAAPTVEETLEPAQVARILGVDPRTIQRRRTASHKLSPLENQRQEKLRRIWEDLLRIYKPENAKKWLTSSVSVLQDRRPIDVMADDGGLDRVLDVVSRMSSGIPD
jgi:putative toxin-antitoxin system antitoxin component (TIGR02293 family)